MDSRQEVGSSKGGSNGRSEVGQSDAEEDNDDDQSEDETGLGFFCTPRSSGAANRCPKAGGSKGFVRELTLGGKGVRDENEACTGVGDGLAARRKHGDDNGTGGDAVGFVVNSGFFVSLKSKMFVGTVANERERAFICFVYELPGTLYY